MISDNKLEELAKVVRLMILKSTTAAGSGHPTSSLSAADLMVTLMFGGFFRANLDDHKNPLNDKLIFSKGHAAPLLYALYFAAGKLSEKDLVNLRKLGSNLEGHPTMNFPYCEAATGSLGQGLSVGFGFALNSKFFEKTTSRSFVLLGDSEMAEGSVWETIQLASYYGTNNLIGFIDVNGLGQRGPTMYGRDVKSYQEKLKAFGWRTLVVDGHNYRQIRLALRNALNEKYRPTMIIAKTVKGKGVKFLENAEGWHGRALTHEEYVKAEKGLGKINMSVRGVVFKPPSQRIAENGGKLHLVKARRFEPGEKISPREIYGDTLVQIFPKHKNIVVLDAEVSNSTGASSFGKVYPEHFFEMFIAEQNMVGTAIGLSRANKIPLVSTFAAFFSRAADQIRMSRYSETNIKFVGTHPGVSIGADGVSQMGLEDIGIFRSELGGAVLYPSDALSASKLLKVAVSHQGNIYLRLTREKLPIIYRESEEFKIGGSKILKQSDRDEVTVIGAGITVHEALKAYENLLEEGIKIRVVDLYSIKPVDRAMLSLCAHETKAILTVEDHYEAGGIGEAVSSGLEGIRIPIFRLCVRKMPHSGTPSELLSFEEIDAAAIEKKVKSLLKK